MAMLSAEREARNDRLIAVAVCLGLTALIWIVFGQTLGHAFINFDDDRYVYENPYVTGGLTGEGMSPVRMIRFRRRSTSGSGIGIAESNAWV